MLRMTTVLHRLDDADTLAGKTRRPIVLACALASAILSLLVDELILGGVFSEGYALSFGQLVGYGLWAVLLGTILGGGAAHLGLRARPTLGPNADTLLLATLGGVLHAALLLVAPAISSIAHGGPRGMEALAAPVMGGTLGAIVSGPVGFLFGLLFLLGIAPTRTHVDRLTHDAPVRAWRWAAVVLATSACLASALAAMLEGSYCQSLLLVLAPGLGIDVPEGTDLAWTRYFAFSTPLLLASLGALARASFLARRIDRTVASLRRGDHPSWVLAPIDTRDAARLPLREDDLLGPALAVCERNSLDAYRDHVAPLALVSRDA